MDYTTTYLGNWSTSNSSTISTLYYDTAANGAAWRQPAVVYYTPQVAKMPEGAALPAKAEDAMSWLKRRVDEIAWVPE